MTFDNILTQVRELLQREGRVSYRALKVRFQLDEDLLEAVKDELIYAKHLAVDEDNRVLVWAGEQAAASALSLAPGTPELASAPVTDPEREPLSYTPQHLAEKILTSRSALEGERKQVTVLFADLKGSMELLADRDPEEARQLLDPVLERMMVAVHRYEGTVNQIMGDGIMALFGAPIAHEDHAVRACYAALAMQATVKQYAVEVQRTQGVPIQIRVGLNAGEVVVRAIGNDLHMDYSAIGQTTHLAARMEQMAMPGSILITQAVLSLAEGYMQVEPLGPVPVKGLSAPVEVFELVGASGIRRRLQATAARGLTRFVGRDTELATLVQALERAGAGHGQVVAVVGEPGVGKSRLVYEFVHAHHTPGWLVLESASVSYGKATPYFPVIDLLKRYSHVEEHDDARTIRAKVTGQILTLDETLQETIPALLSLLDALPEDSPFVKLDPPQRRQRTLDALKRVVLRESHGQPLVLVFEDLHWIDSETQALLDSLVESLPTAPLLLLVNYRLEYQHSWGSKTYYTQLRLDPLPPVSANTLLQALLGDDPSLAPLTQLLITRTQGNPFFLEESVRTLVETQVLVGERGAYRLAKALPSIQMPATVQAVLAARIDRLAPEEKNLLQTAAVIGNEVSLALLQAIAELPEEGRHRGLAHLQATGFLYETRLFPEREYTFKHALTHEVVYGSLLQERRRVLHAQIVEAIERLYANRLSEQTEQLAHHAFKGEGWDKAVAYLQQAAAKASARSANHEAVALFEQALIALQHLPDSRDTRVWAIDLRLDLRGPLWQLEEVQPMFERLREAETLAQGLDDQHRLGRILAHMSRYYSAIGDHQRAVDLAQRSLALATTLNDFSLKVTAHVRLGQAYHLMGDYRRAATFARRNVESLQLARISEHTATSTSSLSSVVSRWILVLALAQLGEFGEGITCGQEAIKVAEAAAHLTTRLHAYHCLGTVYFRKGDIQNAIPVLRCGLELCQTEEIPGWSLAFAAGLGSVYALSGRLVEALPLLEQVEKSIASSELAGLDSRPLMGMSQSYLLAGHCAEAVTYARRALALARTHQERGHEAHALCLLGEIAAHCAPPDVDEAAASYQQALTLADALGMRPHQAHCHLGLGTIYLKMGRLKQARAELSAAIALYRDMDMTFWLPQTEAALAQVEGR